jgi:hypothetical protein
LVINISLEILEKKRKMQIHVVWYAHLIMFTKLLTTFLADGFFNENSLTWNT